MLPVATFGDACGGIIVLPCHITVLVGTPGEIELAAMPGSKVTPHGLPPHQSASLTWMRYKTVYINNLSIRTMNDVATCGDTISTGVVTVIAA